MSTEERKDSGPILSNKVGILCRYASRKVVVGRNGTLCGKLFGLSLACLDVTF